VLAGDIGNPYEKNYDIFMNYINDNFSKTYVIAGNHEYYNNTKTMQETNTYIKNYFTKFPNIKYLDNEYEYYNGYCFIGTTLWSKITNTKYKINDVYYIPNFDCVKYNKLNELCVNFLNDALEKNNNCIVITHHMPSNTLIKPIYKTPESLPYNQWFYCDMLETIELNKEKIKCWIYGHTHTPSSDIISGIPVVCNPIGYPDENVNLDFKKYIVVN
jgi:predicted phosphohydrolase